LCASKIYTVTDLDSDLEQRFNTVPHNISLDSWMPWTSGYCEKKVHTTICYRR